MNRTPIEPNSDFMSLSPSLSTYAVWLGDRAYINARGTLPNAPTRQGALLSAPAETVQQESHLPPLRKLHGTEPHLLSVESQAQSTPIPLFRNGSPPALGLYSPNLARSPDAFPPSCGRQAMFRAAPRSSFSTSRPPPEPHVSQAQSPISVPACNTGVLWNQRNRPLIHKHYKLRIIEESPLRLLPYQRPRGSGS